MGVYYDTGAITVSNNGTVRAVAAGRDYAYAETFYSIYPGICEVNVVENLPAQSVSIELCEGSAGTLSEKTLTLVEGDSAQIRAVINPSNSTDTLAWSGGNDAVTFDETGKITAVKKGNAEITATAGAKSDTITVKVMEHHAAVPATCVADGSVEYWEDADRNRYSDSSGATVITDTAVRAYGHDWDNGVITSSPTLEMEGEKIFTCKRCGKTRTETIPKLEPVENKNYVYTSSKYEWTKGSKSDLEITVKNTADDTKTFEKFDRIEIDGKKVGDYNAKKAALY